MNTEKNRQEGIDRGRLTVMILLSLGILGAVAYLAALDRVTLHVDGTVFERTTAAVTVGNVLKETGIILEDGDEVHPKAKEKIHEGTVIRVYRGLDVTIHADGKTEQLRTIPVAVGEVLRRAGINLGPDDRVSCAVEDRVRPGQEIRVIRVKKRVVTEEVAIQPPVELRKDKNLERGVRRVIERGEPGRMRKTVQITEEDGKVIRKKVLAKETVEQAKKQVILVGARDAVYTMTTSRGREVRYTRMKQMVATAYYPGPESCGKYADGYTATGKKAGFGVVAVDRKVIPLGTMLYIDGYGYAEAADVGSAIKGDKIDLCFDTYREAKMYGKKKIKVYILAPQ